VTRMRLFWSLMIGLALALMILIARHDVGTIAGLNLDDFGDLAVRVALLVFLSGAVFALFRHRFSAALEALMFWILLGLVLAAGYTYRFELLQVGNRIASELVPGMAATRGKDVEIARGRSGEFILRASVNNAPLSFVLDTGASAIVLTQEAAKAAGLPIEVLSYSVSVETANGRTRAAPVTLDQVAIGGISERAVAALIAQPGQLRSNLLGMTFLNRLESWEVRGDKLILRAYP
jgi:aspartyl protease family protein